MPPEPSPTPFHTVAFDLLTALIDSWSLWEAVAGDAGAGRRWREASLRLVTSSGAYRDYEAIVAEAAVETGISPDRSRELIERWATLTPYPDSTPVLRTLHDAGFALVVVTNTSQRLAELAAARLEIPWAAVTSAEKAGHYKPDPRAYRAGAEAAGGAPGSVLFVAGSAHDVTGAAAAGLPVYWANRRRLPVPTGAHPIADEPDLRALPELLGVAGPR